MEEAVPRSGSRLPGLLKKDYISPLRKIPLFIAAYLREIFHGNGHISCVPYYGQRTTVIKSLEQNGISKYETAKPGTEQNITKVKGLEYLIRACAILRAKGFSLRCRIVGKGPEKESLEKLILQLDLQNSVEIRDPVPHYMVRDIYRKTKLFVLPIAAIDGVPYGIPDVIVEAMAMGLPVISTDVPDISELIENGKSGLIVMQKNPDALADAIEMLLNDRSKYTAMGRVARKRVEREFDTKKHIQRISEIFGQEEYWQ